MKFQKILVLCTLIVAALTFVYALSYMTSLSDLYYYSSTAKGKEALEGVDSIYNFASTTNDVFLYLSIVFILLAAFMYITATNTRRNYYITNYISIALVTVFALVFAGVGFAMVSVCVARFFALDLDKYLELYNTWSELLSGQTVVSDTSPGELYSRVYPYHSDPTAFFVIGYVVYALVVVVAAANIFNLVWKIKLMKGEKALLSAGLVKEVA